MYGVAVTVGKDLNFHVARFDHRFFQDQLARAKSVLGLGPGPGYGSRQIIGVRNQTHTASAAARRRLDHQGKADFRAFRRQYRLILIGAAISQHAGHRGLGHAQLGQALVAHQLDSLGRWTNEGQPGIGAALGESRILGQKTITGMHRVRPGLGRRRQNRRNVQIGLSYGGLANADRLIGHLHMWGARIGFGINRNRTVAQMMRRPHDAAGNFAAIGNQDLAEGHGFPIPSI